MPKISAGVPSPFRPPRLVRLIHSAHALKPRTVKQNKWHGNDRYSICYLMPSSTLSYSRNFGSYCRKCQPGAPYPPPPIQSLWAGRRPSAGRVYATWQPPLDRPAGSGQRGKQPIVYIRLKVVCRLALAIWSYWYGCREQIFLNISKAANPLETP